MLIRRCLIASTLLLAACSSEPPAPPVAKDGVSELAFCEATIQVTQLHGPLAPKEAKKVKEAGGWRWHYESQSLQTGKVDLLLNAKQDAVEVIEVIRPSGIKLLNLTKSAYGEPQEVKREGGRRISRWRFQLDPCRAQVDLEAHTADAGIDPDVELLRWTGVKAAKGEGN